MESFTYYLIPLKSAYGYSDYDGYLNPVEDMFLTDNYDVALAKYRERYKVGAPCKVSVPYKEGYGKKRMRNHIKEQIKRSKVNIGIKSIKVITEWTE